MKPDSRSRLLALPAMLSRWLLMIPIVIYRYAISPFTPSTCRHLPTCSQYAEEAIRKNGPWKGLWLAISRILRCNPWGSQGFDPVPDLNHEHHPFYAPWRYGRWRGRHIKQGFAADCPENEKSGNEKAGKKEAGKKTPDNPPRHP